MTDTDLTLENLNCPQFVDFTSVDAFNINDGADLLFENRMVGEKELELGMSAEELIEAKKEEAVKLLKESANHRHVAAAIKMAAAKKTAAKTPASSRVKSQTESKTRTKENVPPSTSTNKTRPLKYDSNKYSASKPEPITNKTIFVESHVIKAVESKGDETKVITVSSSSRKVTNTIQLDQTIVKEDARADRRRSKSCGGQITLNKTLVVRTTQTNSSRNSRRTMLEIKEDELEKTVTQPRNPSKPRTPCFERLYNQRHKSADRTHVSSSSATNASQTPLLSMYRGLKFVPKFGSKQRMSPAPSMENIYQSKPSKSGTSTAPPSKPPTPPLPVSSTRANAAKAKEQLLTNLTQKIEKLKIVYHNQTSAKPSNSEASKAVHQPIIVSNRTVVKPESKPVRVVGAPQFRTEARALKRQESVASLSDKKPSPPILTKKPSFSAARSSSQTCLRGVKPTQTSLVRARNAAIKQSDH